MKVRSAKKQLYEYTVLQEQLCNALFEKYPIDDVNFLTDLPRNGSLIVGNSFWEFQRHGLGVCFTQSLTGEVVDVHTDVFFQKRGIDAWRLVQYFESSDVGKLIDNGIEFDAKSESSLLKMLDGMHRNGWLILASQSRCIYLIAK